MQTSWKQDRLSYISSNSLESLFPPKLKSCICQCVYQTFEQLLEKSTIYDQKAQNLFFTQFFQIFQIIQKEDYQFISFDFITNHPRQKFYLFSTHIKTMQKHAYLQFFKKKMSFKKQAQQSLDQSWTIEDQIHNSPKNASGICSVVTQQADTVESPLSDPSYSLQKQFPRSFHFTDHIRKSHHIKNIRVHNKSSQAFKRKQSECNDQSQSKYSLNARKNFSQFHQKPLTSQQMKAVKFMTPNLKKITPRNQSQIGKRLKTLQAPDILEQQKLFTQPIKPYDRNKTARNKKFRTLKTAFGDLNSSCRNYNDQYTMSLQNLRMGWRIVNKRSMIEEYLNSTYFTYHLYNGNMINKEKNKDTAQKEKKKST